MKTHERQRRTIFTFPPDQHRAGLLLAQGHSMGEVARLTGKSRSTIYKWLTEDDQFHAFVLKCMEDIYAAALARLPELVRRALNVMESVLDDPYAKRTDKQRAAEFILGRLLRLPERIRASASEHHIPFRVHGSAESPDTKPTLREWGLTFDMESETEPPGDIRWDVYRDPARSLRERALALMAIIRSGLPADFTSADISNWIAEHRNDHNHAPEVLAFLSALHSAPAPQNIVDARIAHSNESDMQGSDISAGADSPTTIAT